MNAIFKTLHLALIFLGLLAMTGCKKDSASPTQSEPTYPVSAVVLNPAGQRQGGAILKLASASDTDPQAAAYTDSTGAATIYVPAGQQTLVAKMGTVLLTEFSVNVQASQTPTNAGVIKLVQNALKKILVVTASAEEIETVLQDTLINLSTFDKISVYALNDSIAVDSTRALNFLEQYNIVFSDCDGGSEEAYTALSRVYGRYLQAGGSLYGGHYNYYHLQRLFPGSYTQSAYSTATTDSIYISDQSLSSYLNFKTDVWSSSDSRGLSGYEIFSDIPSTAKIYASIQGTSIPVIVENHFGAGKFLWTDYHNQDVIYATPRDPKLVKIVQYFLYTL